MDDKKIELIVEKVIVQEKATMFENINKTQRKNEAIRIIETIMKDET